MRLCQLEEHGHAVTDADVRLAGPAARATCDVRTTVRDFHGRVGWRVTVDPVHHKPLSVIQMHFAYQGCHRSSVLRLWK